MPEAPRPGDQTTLQERHVGEKFKPFAGLVQITLPTVEDNYYRHTIYQHAFTFQGNTLTITLDSANSTDTFETFETPLGEVRLAKTLKDDKASLEEVPLVISLRVEGKGNKQATVEDLQELEKHVIEVAIGNSLYYLKCYGGAFGWDRASRELWEETIRETGELETHDLNLRNANGSILIVLLPSTPAQLQEITATVLERKLDQPARIEA